MVKRITVKIPKTPTDKWVTHRGGRPLNKKTIGDTFSALKRFFASNSASDVSKKWRVLVRYPDGGKNETITSNDKNYLLFATACFLEDYLSKETLKRTEKDYFRKEGDTSVGG